MSQAKLIFGLLLGLGVAGIAIAEQDVEAVKAECKIQAEEQGVTDVEAFVAQCVEAMLAEEGQVTVTDAPGFIVGLKAGYPIFIPESGAAGNGEDRRRGIGVTQRLRRKF